MECPPTTFVGLNYLTVVVAPGPTLARKAAPVYNVEPFFGHPSMVAFPNSAEEAVYVVGSLDPVDQHVNFAISDLSRRWKAARPWSAPGSSSTKVKPFSALGCDLATAPT